MIRVGGATDVEVKERKDRVDDAVHAFEAAMEEGVLAGGGVGYLHSARALADLATANDDQRMGVDILRRSLSAPAFEIAANAGENAALIIGRLLEAKSTDEGSDAQRGVFGDMVAAGIIDPTKVVRLALENAESVASLLITTQVLVHEKPEPKKRPAGAAEEGYAEEC